MPLDGDIDRDLALWASPEARRKLNDHDLVNDEPPQALWASPETKPTVEALSKEYEWARVGRSLRPTRHRVVEWYFETMLLGYDKLGEAVEINPRRRGGVPVLKGTRFTVAQTLAELADTSGVDEVARNYDLDANVIRKMLEGLSLVLMRRIMK
jgi:uncharacterized protein (DUF433 family)